VEQFRNEEGEKDAKVIEDSSAPPLWARFYDLETGEPYFWHAEFPTNVQEAMLTDENPTGTYTNSNFELAATVLHESILGSPFNLKHCTAESTMHESFLDKKYDAHQQILFCQNPVVQEI